ncbi:MAG: hypothetical protein PQJ50_10525, partial [Spirochaetales bacterium]|nr:hypothetical protein [Spirochaetales bacterium]
MFEKTDAYVQVYDLTLQARNTPDASLIRLRSDLVNADITGQYRLSQLPGSFRNMADHYVDIYPLREDYRDTSTFISYDIQIGRLNPLLNFFFPGLLIAEGSLIRGKYNPASYSHSLEANFPQVAYNDFKWHHVLADASSSESAFSAHLRADSLCFGDGYSLENQELEFQAKEQDAHLSLHWSNDELPLYSGLLS